MKAESLFGGNTVPKRIIMDKKNRLRAVRLLLFAFSQRLLSRLIEVFGGFLQRLCGLFQTFLRRVQHLLFHIGYQPAQHFGDDALLLSVGGQTAQQILLLYLLQ